MNWIAVQSMHPCLKNLSLATCDTKYVNTRAGRIFFRHPNSISDSTRSKIADEISVQLGGKLCETDHVGFGRTCGAALMGALAGDDNENKWPIHFLFDFIHPHDDSQDRGIEAQLETQGVKTFAECRRRLQSSLPSQMRFLTDLFFEADRRNENEVESREGAISAISKIQNRLGREHVFTITASQNESSLGLLNRTAVSSPSLNPGAYLSVVELDGSNLIPNDPRPSRLLQIPIPISRFENKLLSSDRRWNCSTWGPPQSISMNGILEKVDREYFTVETEEGECLWIYRELLTGRLYLHGTFD
jgi:hypothetical protein